MSPIRLAIAAASAIVVNLVVFWIGSAAGATWQITAPYSVGAPTVVISTLVPIVLAGVVTWLLARRWPKVQGWFAWAGLGFGLLTTPMSFLSSFEPATGTSLALMHVVAGVAWLLGVRPATGTN